MYKNKNKSNIGKYQAGMTLVELVVVVAIFIIVAGITIFDYGRFRSNVSLQNLSDDIALSVRRAQGFAIGVESSLNTFSNGYGIHFSNVVKSKIALSGTKKSFIIFADIADKDGNRNKFYDYDKSIILDSGDTGPNASILTSCSITTLEAGKECLDFLSITSNDEVIKICPNGDQNTCLASGYVDITFIRPNPNAFICAYEDDAQVPCDLSSGLTSVDIVVRNVLSQNTKTITVSNVGQISVQ